MICVIIITFYFGIRPHAGYPDSHVISLPVLGIACMLSITRLVAEIGDRTVIVTPRGVYINHAMLIRKIRIRSNNMRVSIDKISGIDYAVKVSVECRRTGRRVVFGVAPQDAQKMVDLLISSGKSRQDGLIVES